VNREHDGQDVTTSEGQSASPARDPDELTDRELEHVSGGIVPAPKEVVKKPAPGGPVPVPYPNST
jgi:hypothetical protein